MTSLITEIWVCQANIQRFQGLLRSTLDAERRRLLAGLLEQEEQGLRDLMWAQELRRRLIRLIADQAVRTVVETLLDDAIAIADASAGNVQAIDPDVDLLRIVASRGHAQPFLTFFGGVKSGTSSACGRALMTGQPVWVEDVESSPAFAGTDSGRVMREAGSRAVQSTPLFGRAHLVGILSTHWRTVTRPDPDRQRQLDMRIKRAQDDLLTL